MAIKIRDRDAFNLILWAAKNDQLLLSEVKNAETGDYGAMLCVVRPTDGEGYDIAPIGMLRSMLRGETWLGPHEFPNEEANTEDVDAREANTEDVDEGESHG